MKLKKVLIVAAIDIALIQVANILTADALAQGFSAIGAYSANTEQSDMQKQENTMHVFPFSSLLVLNIDFFVSWHKQQIL